MTDYLIQYPYLRDYFDQIHNTPEHRADSEKYRQEIKYHLLKDAITELHTKAKLTWLESYETVQAAHIKYMEELFVAKWPEGIIKEFSVGEKQFVSKQIPVGKMRNGFHRSDEGLAAFRHHQLIDKERGAVLTEAYLHSSPTPGPDSPEKTFLEEVRFTASNLEQVPGDHVVEIRLLTPLHRSDERRQLFLTAIAAELCNKPVTVFNFGVNATRKLAKSGFQAELNKRALTKLLSPTPLPPLFSEKDLEALDESHAQTFFLNKLKEANRQTFLQIAKTPEQEKTFAEFMALYEKDEWAEPQNSYKIHVAIAKLCKTLGNRTVALGCKNAIDRANRFIVSAEADAIAEYMALEKISSNMQRLEKTVYDNSTPLVAAEWFSTPYLIKGLGVGGKFDTAAHAHLDNDRTTSGIFKRIWTDKHRKFYGDKDLLETKTPSTLNLGKKITNAANAVKNFFAGIWKNILSLFVVLGIMSSVATADPANSNTSPTLSSNTAPPIVSIATTEVVDETKTPSSGSSSPRSQEGSYVDEEEVGYSPAEDSEIAEWLGKKAVNTTTVSPSRVMRNRSQHDSQASPREGIKSKYQLANLALQNNLRVQFKL